MTAVLVTRAEPGATQTARRLIDLNYTPIIAPLLRVTAVDGARLDVSGAQALLFTSANGVRAFAELGGEATLPALCVGDATALAARDAGFKDVRSAGGDAANLVALAQLTLTPAKGALLWASGEDISQDIAALLAPAGFTVRRAIVYRAEAEPGLPDAAAQALQGGDLAAILFHSARAAEAFAALANAAGLADRTADLPAICISARVAKAAQALAWGRIVSAKDPDEESLLAALEALLAA